MVQTANALREMWRKRYSQVLDWIFEEYASGKLIRPDDAMDLMEELLEKLVGEDEQSSLDRTTPRPVPIMRFDFDAYRREAHHYAVDRFYKTYFPRKRGAPQLSEGYLDQILQLKSKGLNYVAIAEKLGQPKDRMRHQVKAAELYWNKVAERIKQRFPHFVAQETTREIQKERAFPHY